MKHNLFNKTALALSLAMATPLAFAGGAAAPDLSEITDLFPLYGAAVVGVIIAFAVVQWTKRAASLAKPG